jgi:phosphatidylinositol dimannoside acyltransferase
VPRAAATGPRVVVRVPDAVLVSGRRTSLLTFRAATAIAGTLPPALGERLAHVGGRVARRTMVDRRVMVARHQRRARDGAFDVDAAVAGAFDSYARYWYDLFRLPAAVRRGEVPAHFTIEGYEHIEKGLDAGNGVILALPHLGGWEYGAAWMAYKGHRMVAVVEPIEPPDLYQWFAAQRRAYGLDIVPLGAGASAALLRALRDDRIVCLLSDRDLQADGVEVEFFGERTTLPGGPATLALRTGAALLPAAVYFRTGGQHVAVVQPPVLVEREGRLRDDVARITQALAHEFEGLIRAAPEQWHLMQPNWPSDREGVHACES